VPGAIVFFSSNLFLQNKSIYILLPPRSPYVCITVRCGLVHHNGSFFGTLSIETTFLCLGNLFYKQNSYPGIETNASYSCSRLSAANARCLTKNLGREEAGLSTICFGDQ
jgi:hypothetical protein